MAKLSLLKEAATARNKLSLEQLLTALVKQRTRHGVMKQAGVFPDDYLASVEASIDDLRNRIDRKEAVITKNAQKQILDTAIGI